jgi:Fe-S-cluster containining protein
MEIDFAYIDAVFSDLKQLPQPDYAKVCREGLKRAMSRFLNAPGMMLPLTARQTLIRCKRCGECCRYCNPISLDEGECRAIAGHLGMSDSDFKGRYIDAHQDEEEDESNEGDLVIMKGREMHCPFYDAKKGCGIYEVRPAACRVFPYLHRDVVDESVHNGRMVCFRNCPAAVELDSRIKDMSRMLRIHSGVYIYANSRANDIDGMLIYILNVFLKGMENNDGPDVARRWLVDLGMGRLATDEELDRLSLLVCGLFMEFPVKNDFS